MTISEAVTEIIKLRGLEIFKNTKIFFAMLDDLSPEYKKERRIIKNNINKNILNLFIDNTKKVTHRLRLLQMQFDDLGVTRDWSNFIIESFAIPLGWKNEIEDLKVNAPIQNNSPIQQQKQINNSFTDVTLDDKILEQLGIIDKKNITSINIPSNYKTILGDNLFRITKIKNELFKNCELLESVTIPNTITEIGESAFENCKSLKKINIPDSVTKIGNRAFAYCKTLEYISISNSVVEIGNGAFGGCVSLITAIISNNIKKIEKVLFAKCKSLTNIIIPNGITQIDDLAFIGCESLNSIIIPNSVTKIGNKVFANCTSLTSAIISNNITEIGTEIFIGCNKLQQLTLPIYLTIFKDNNVNINLSSSKIKNSNQQLQVTQHKNAVSQTTKYIEVTLDDTVLKQLGYQINNGILTKTILKNNQNIDSIVIPSTYKYNGKEYKITKIGNNAFLRCSFLKNIIIPNSITEIEDEAFRGCTSLTDIIIPNSVIKIGKCLFSWCSSLTNVKISNNLNEISSNTFALCNSLTNITIPDSVTKIGTFAFSMCKSLKSITIPNSVKHIDEHAFFGISHIYYKGTATGSPWGAERIN